MKFKNNTLKSQAMLICNMYFLERKTKSQIANELNLSRFKVARLIDDAVESGLIQFIIAGQNNYEEDLADQISKKFGIRNVIISANTERHGISNIQNLAKLGSAFLEKIITKNMKIGVSWGKTISATIDAIHNIPPIEAIQTLGSCNVGDFHNNAINVVHKLAKTSNGKAFPVYLPLWINDVNTVKKLKLDSSVLEVRKKYDQLDVIIASVGSWKENSISMRSILPQEWLEKLLSLEVCSDFCGIPINKQGQFINWLDKFSVGITAKQIKKVPEVILIAGGIDKKEAILAAIKTKCVNTLITDIENIRYLLT